MSILNRVKAWYYERQKINRLIKHYSYLDRLNMELERDIKDEGANRNNGLAVDIENCKKYIEEDKQRYDEIINRLK